MAEKFILLLPRKTKANWHNIFVLKIIEKCVLLVTQSGVVCIAHHPAYLFDSQRY